MVKQTLNIKILAILFVITAGFMLPTFASAKTLEELRAELNEKRKTLQASEQRIKQFKQDIQLKRREARTLKDQIAIMDEDIQEIELTIKRTTDEITTTSLEIEATQREIEIKEQEIDHQKAVLAELIRSIHILDQQSSITVFLKYETFSEAISESSTLAELQGRGQHTLNVIKKLHEELNTKKRELEDFKASLEALRLRQEDQQRALENQRTAKQRILDLTRQQEEQYKGLLKKAQESEIAAQSAIKELDAKIREELRKQGIGRLASPGVMDWPIEPIFGISCGFRCPGYPYAYLIGPHSGADIPTYVGTPIKAPADGYVARTHDSGGPGYSYIMIIHGDDISTVYGHVSGFALSEGQMVSRGTVIGYTGGVPGARGSGLSSGPHLHFEVRKNSIPVNPLPYLPSI